MPSRLRTTELRDFKSLALWATLLPRNHPRGLPPVASVPEATEWLNQHALTPFLNEVREERVSEINRIADHINLSLTELLQKVDEEIGKAAAEVENKVTGAEGRLAQAENRHAELMARREKRRQELEQQRALTLQSVERMTSILVLPHPERSQPEVRRLQPDPEVEATAMQIVIEHERSRGCQVYDIHEKNLGYDITSLDLNSGELRLIEVKGIGAATGTVLLTPNERRVAEDRRDCYWLMARREKRRQELEQQRALTLQSVERMTSILVLPHPERFQPEVRRLQPDPGSRSHGDADRNRT